jgi:hypothetical protein
MTFIVSRRFRLPRTPEDLAADFYFNLWQRRQWPPKEIRVGATLFLYESPTQLFVWKTRVRRVCSMKYDSLGAAYDWLRKHYADFDRAQPYLVQPPERGYCLAFECDPIERLDISKPKRLTIPMLGWVKDPDFIKACGLAGAATAVDVARGRTDNEE